MSTPTPTVSTSTRRGLAGLCVGVLCLLQACAIRQVPADAASAPMDGNKPGIQEWAVASTATPAVPGAPPTWEHWRLPGKLATQFKSVRHGGRLALSADSRGSASMLRKQVRVAPEHLHSVAFSWKVPALIDGSDIALRDHDDSPVRVVLAFDGDRSRMSGRDRAMSELAQALTGEPMPYATLMYSWCKHRPVGSVIHNPRTDRIRTLVVESGPRRLNQWLDYERDVAADYERAFGEKPGALIGIAVMTDSDNTRSAARAWYGPVRMSRVARATSPY